MRQIYTYSTRWEKNNVAIIHIYGAWEIIQIFCDHQDTKSKSYDIEMGKSQPELTHKKISNALWENDIHTL